MPIFADARGASSSPRKRRRRQSSAARDGGYSSDVSDVGGDSLVNRNYSFVHGTFAWLAYLVAIGCVFIFLLAATDDVARAAAGLHLLHAGITCEDVWARIDLLAGGSVGARALCCC